MIFTNPNFFFIITNVPQIYLGFLFNIYTKITYEDETYKDTTRVELFHYTLTDYLDDIKIEGLIPRKNPNSYYKDGSEGIFLTTSQSLYKANLPQSLMDVMDEYYENEENYETKPIVRLWIDVTKLDLDKLTWDDDYILNKYGWNKAETDSEKIIESLDIWGSVAYLGVIPKNLIVKYDFDYLN